MSDLSFRDRARDRRVGLWLAVGLVVVLGGLYVAAYALTSERVPRGTTVAGVEIGGMRPAAAERALAAGLRPRVDQPIPVRAEGVRTGVDPDEAGLSLDVAESVAQAGGGRTWNPVRMWNYVVGGEDYDAVVAVDETALDQAVARLAEQVDRPAREGGVTFHDGVAQAQLGEPGLTLDADATAQQLKAAYLDADRGAVQLPVEEIEPEVSRQDVATAMEEFANPAMSAPVTFRFGGKDGREVEVEPSAYGAALSMQPQDGRLVPVLDEQALRKAIRPSMRKLHSEPQPATVRLVDGRPKVVPGKAGVRFDPADIYDQFLTLVVQRGKNRTMAVEAVTEQPEFDVRDARRLGIKEVVSEFSTSYPHSDYRNTNLGRAAELVNGTVLRPGETFSMNKTTGERTKANGFTEGFIISNGVYKEAYGGGVSQVATTLFNAAFFAGLEDVEHEPHSFYIDRYPVGREATVVWGALDLRFKNDTPYGVLIESWIEPSTPSRPGSMNVRMWSTDYWDIETSKSERYDLTEPETRYIQDPECVPHEGYGGFDIDVYRSFYRAGSDELHHRQTFHTMYTPSDTVICGPEPGSEATSTAASDG